MKYTQSLVAFCSFAMFSLPAFGQVTINETTTPIGSLSQFSYSITNIGSTPVASITIEVETTITSIIVPTGWIGNTSPFGSSTLIHFDASDSPFSIKIGETLTGFSFVSTSDVGTVPYSAFDDNFNNFDGVTQGPVLITSSAPEPHSGAMLLSGAVLLFCTGLFIKRNRKS
jgi:hypothetical protein